MESRLWKVLWDHDPNGLIVLDFNLRVVQTNMALARMFQSEVEALRGRPAVELFGDVKANILARMTTEIIVSMMRADAPLEDVIETVVGTLPMCKVRKIACSGTGGRGPPRRAEGGHGRVVLARSCGQQR